jgi:hypothetical protein
MPSPITFAKWLLLPLALLLAALLGLANYKRHPSRVRFLYLFRLAFLAGLALLIFAPALRRELSRTTRPELRVLVDASLSMSLDDGRGKPRTDRARESIELLQRSFGEAFRISAYTFGSSLKTWPDPKTAAAVPPREPSSDLSGALKALTSSSDQGQVRGLFVLTDGAHTSNTPPAVWARTSQTPIYTIGIGSEQYAYKDLAITNVQAPEVAFKESNLTFTVQVRGKGIPDRERVPVTLAMQGRTLETQTVELAEGAGSVRFTIKPEKPGLNVYRVALPQQPGELSHANNTRDVSVFVEEKPREIMLVSTQPTWETAFLRRALSQDPRFVLRAHELQLKGKQFEWQAQDLAKHRMVILNRFHHAAFQQGQMSALADYVQRGEGALLVLGTTPEDAEDLFNSPIGKVLPVQSPEGRWETPKRLNLTLTPLGIRHPACTVLPHPQANLLAWKNLPPIMPSVIVAASGDVTSPVIASFPYYPKDIVAIAYRTFGRGVVVFVNTWETHLLKLLPAAAEDRDAVYPTFVSNLTDWMTDQARSAGVSLMLARLRFAQGEPVDVAVNDYQGLLEGGEVALSVRREDHPTPMTVKLARTEDGIAGSFTPEVPGVYTISLPVPGRPAVEKTILVQEDSRELETPFANHAGLRELAQGSGGAFFAEGDPNLARLALDAAPLVLTVQSEKLWLDDGMLLAALLILVCIEWILRRQRHLV